MARRTSSIEEGREPGSSLNLALELKHFGPIRHADIRVAPLTVLIGPNNSGKSFFALALHALLGWTRAWPFERRWWALGDAGGRMEGEGTRSIANEAVETLGRLAANGTADVTPLLEKHLRRVSTAPLGARVMRLYQAHPAELRSAWGRKGLRVSFRSQHSCVALSVDSTGFQIKDVGVDPLHLTVRETGEELARVHAREDGTYEMIVSSAAVAGDAAVLAHRPSFDPLGLPLWGWSTRGLPGGCYYLPAGRSGIMQTYDTIVQAVLQNASQAPFGLHIPGVAGTTAEFLASLLSRRGRVPVRQMDSPIAAATEHFEQAALNGTISVDFEDGGPAPSFTYRSPVGDLPLIRASSSVLEVAPLSIYLRRLVRRRDLLIIEEPEAHLHPANQRRMARLLAALIRAGVYVLITTHSDYLVEQLRALRMAGELEEDERAKVLEETPEAYLQGDDLRIYLFEGPCNGEGEFVGSTARELPWRIDEDQEPGYYEQVDQALYDELTTLERRIWARR